MTRPLAVLRPEPGNAATAARIVAAGHHAIRLPLFAVQPIEWTPPRPEDHDALILTSANTLRHGGVGLAGLASLPVLAVGETTATAARAAGFDVVLTGTEDAAQLFAAAAARGVGRALHLGGRDRTVPGTTIVAATIPVYASDPLPVAADALCALADSVVLLHSSRAARRLASIVPHPARLRLAAISATVLAAAGSGWNATTVAAAPHDNALIAAAATLAD